jgi:hypothetical protein
MQRHGRRTTVRKLAALCKSILNRHKHPAGSGDLREYRPGMVFVVDPVYCDEIRWDFDRIAFAEDAIGLEQLLVLNLWRAANGINADF